MSTVLHIIDAGVDENQAQVLEVLQARLRLDGCPHFVCSLDGPAAARAARFCSSPILRAEIRLPWVNWAPKLAGVARRCEARLLHAWGPRAAAAAASALPELPLVVTLLNPEISPEAARWLRSIPRYAAVATSTQATRSRLLEAGLATDRIVVIRGPVDFAAINQAHQNGIRQAVVGNARPVLLLHGSGGSYHGIWAGAVLSQVIPGLRVILPYPSGDSARMERLAEATRIPDLLIVPHSLRTWSELVTCADVFVAPAKSDIPIEPLLIAMAAGVPVVGTAVGAMAEIIKDGHNGLLCEPDDGHVLARQILRLLEDEDLCRRLKETARGQAYEVATLRGFIDNYARLYHNVMSQLTAGDGVQDAAVLT